MRRNTNDHGADENGDDSLKEALLEQKRFIEEKYSECTVKYTINVELLKN